MKTKSFQKYLEKRLTKEEIAQIEEEAKQELATLQECTLCPPDHIYNAETQKALKDSYDKKNLVVCKDEDDLFKRLGIKVKKKADV